MTGEPLHVIIIGMPSCIIFSISLQQALKTSMFMPWAGVSWHIIMSGFTSKAMAHIIDGITDIIGIIMGMGIDGVSLTHIMAILPDCITIGMPACAIISSISQLL